MTNSNDWQNSGLATGTNQANHIEFDLGGGLQNMREEA